MLRREIFADVTSAAPPARIVIRLTYAGDQPCHGLAVASRTWPIFFGCSSTGPGLPGSFVDDCLIEPAQQNLQISANPEQARHFGSWYQVGGVPPHTKTWGRRCPPRPFLLAGAPKRDGRTVWIWLPVATSSTKAVDFAIASELPLVSSRTRRIRSRHHPCARLRP